MHCKRSGNVLNQKFLPDLDRRAALRLAMTSGGVTQISPDKGDWGVAYLLQLLKGKQVLLGSNNFTSRLWFAVRQARLAA